MAKRTQYEQLPEVIEFIRQEKCDGYTCLRCGGETKVIDNRSPSPIENYPCMVRTRECKKCGYRQKTIEVLVECEV